jgi:hypothetical protein
MVVQLQFLDLMIRKGSGAVSMDAATRADLINLMARVVMAVFHEEGEAMTEVYSPKIKPEHLARKAIVYLRQLIHPLILPPIEIGQTARC